LAQKVERYKRRRQYIDENVIWRYLVQCLKALQYLHERGICHRDIKAANTFLAEDGSIKLGDMNVSKRLQKGQLQTQIGTPYYMSPEIWNNRPYDASADLWALGCMIYGRQLGCASPPLTPHTSHIRPPPHLALSSLRCGRRSPGTVSRS
jgi:NIMA (never in mitosis gene a)-related kinase